MYQFFTVCVKITSENKLLANKEFEIKFGELNKHENKFIRNIIIYKLYLEKIREGKLGKMDIYINIETYLREKFNVICDANTIRNLLVKMAQL
jgi:hypothetical protein